MCVCAWVRGRDLRARRVGVCGGVWVMVLVLVWACVRRDMLEAKCDQEIANRPEKKTNDI